ncbi:hypothetical protein QEZ54_35255, partial [Catellatospora sp. KI3]|uniref:hypothetical protein n=1 Tax=Catellatospora sp. KI3 TaxID=3041620 RepID=UPI0024823BEE
MRFIEVIEVIENRPQGQILGGHRELIVARGHSAQSNGRASPQTAIIAPDGRPGHAGGRVASG